MIFYIRFVVGILMLCSVPAIWIFNLVFILVELEVIKDLDPDQVRAVYRWMLALIFCGFVVGGFLPVLPGNTLYHLTTTSDAEAIRLSERLGAQFGIFALGWLPPTPKWKYGPSSLLRAILTLVPKRLTDHIPITGEAVKDFKLPLPIGPFSLSRRLLGVFSAPLGSFDPTTSKLLWDEIRLNDRFQQADDRARQRYRTHQRWLDYYIDILHWLGLFGPGVYYTVCWFAKL